MKLNLELVRILRGAAVYEQTESERLGIGEHERASLRAKAEGLEAGADWLEDFLRKETPLEVESIEAQLRAGETPNAEARFTRELDELLELLREAGLLPPRNREEGE
jgi:hypothetical protein